MAVDTFIAFVGVYDSAADADADYQFIKDLHTKEGLIDAYDAAVVEHRPDGKVGVSDMGAKIERAMKRARKVEARELKADTAEIEADAKSAQA